jgi:spore germination protein GerM
MPRKTVFRNKSMTQQQQAKTRQLQTGEEEGKEKKTAFTRLSTTHHLAQTRETNYTRPRVKLNLVHTTTFKQWTPLPCPTATRT